jgi:hypothetical protein
MVGIALANSVPSPNSRISTNTETFGEIAAKQRLRHSCNRLCLSLGITRYLWKQKSMNKNSWAVVNEFKQGLTCGNEDTCERSNTHSFSPARTNGSKI